jgi:dihydroxyacetone kinase-like protein
MSKGMGLALEQLDGLPDPDMTTGFQTVSAVLMGRIGGSMGPLYGSLFRGLAVASRERDEVDAATMTAMLAKGLASVGRVTDAQVGDKTLMDVLVPATAAFTAAQEAGASFAECCDALAAAAEAGLESTRHLVARIGRAARLGERSRGHLDAGAASCCLVLTAIARASNDLLDV